MSDRSEYKLVIEDGEPKLVLTSQTRAQDWATFEGRLNAETKRRIQAEQKYEQAEDANTRLRRQISDDNDSLRKLMVENEKQKRQIENQAGTITSLEAEIEEQKAQLNSPSAMHAYLSGIGAGGKIAELETRCAALADSFREQKNLADELRRQRDVANTKLQKIHATVLT